MKKKRKILKFKKPSVFVPMCLDLIHHGHINILSKAEKYGNVIIGLMTDDAIKRYKEKLLSNTKIEKIVESFKLYQKYF